MNENKKIDLSELYYATIVDEKGNIDYFLGTGKKGVFTDIRNDKKYVWNGRNYKFYKNSIEVKLKAFVSYGLVVKNSFYGTKTVKEIIEKDKFIAKEIYEKTNEYGFYDAQDINETLAIIKPDGVKNAIKIIDMIYKTGLSIEKYEVRMLDKEILSEHYSHLTDKPFYPKLENYMLSGEVILMILKGENAVEKLRNLMGPTDSTKAPKGTIRGEFGTDITYNAIHGSDSNTNALIEINRFFKQKQKRI